MRPLLATLILALAAFFVPYSPVRASRARAEVVIGSKAFPESWILGEAARALIGRSGGSARHAENMGGTEIVFAALRASAIDLYPEYTGTISEVILKRRGAQPADLGAMRDALADQGIGISAPLGFNDGYALAMRRSDAERLRVTSLSDLARHPELRMGLSHEFLGRADGWPGLASTYGFAHQDVRGIQHDLSYEAIASGAVDAIDIYTTDAQIANLDLRVLADDRAFFPRYDAVFLYRLDLESRAPEAFRAILRLEGTIGEEAMVAANARVVIDRASPAAAAHSLLESVGLIPGGAPHETAARSSVGRSILRDTAVHLRLVLLSLTAAVAVGLPLGVAGSRRRRLGGAILWSTGVLQTVPSLVLLALLIPLLGIGFLPALAALFVYSLLPIVRNTHVGLITIPRELIDSAEALGLSPWARLLRIELPLTAPSIVAGIKTSAVINVGTATIAALVGAGGLGSPILQGIALRDTGLILRGAVPAGALALVLQWVMDLLDPLVIPKGLRSKRA